MTQEARGAAESIDAEALEEQRQFTVLGAGVIGLLAAGELARQGHDVTVISTEGKPEHGTDTASSIAVGQFLPWVPEEHAETLLGGMSIGEVTEVSRGFYNELAKNPHETGVMRIRNVEFVRSDSPWPAGLAEAMHVTDEQLEHPLTFTDPAGAELPFDRVLSFDTFSINTRKAVVYLADRAKELGVKFVRQTITPEQLSELEGIIINATGAGAKDLEPFQVVKEYKGHTFVVKPREGKAAPSEALSVEDLIVMPREDGTVICGALYIEDPARPIPEEAEAEELFDRLGKLIKEAAGQVEGLEPDFLDTADVIMHSAGYRVEVEGSGIRIAPDPTHERLLHAYGFGGLGWSVGPHFAKQIVAKAQEMHQQTQE